MLNDLNKWLEDPSDILKYPSPCLVQPCTHVPTDNPDVMNTLRDVCDVMFIIMYQAKGVGLAAPQVNLPYRFFVMNITGDPTQHDKEMIFINPAITRSGTRATESLEGCLSLPGISAKITRADKVYIEYTDLTGTNIKVQFQDGGRGLYSRVSQHESDHLDGILFIDHLKPKQKEKILNGLQQPC